MMKSGARWVLVGSLASILMMGGLGLAMGKKVEKEEATAQVEVEQKKIETGQKGEEEAEKDKVKAGRKTAKGEKKEELKLELIWKKEFDQNIGNIGVIPSSVLLEEAKKAPGTVSAPVFPIRTVVTDYGKKVTFFNQKGEIESEIKLGKNQWATISQNGEYVVIQTWDKEGQYATTTELKDKNGHTLWKKENYPGVIISSKGEAIGIINMQGGDEVIGIAGLWFYDKGGNLIKQVEIPLRWGEVSLSEDGSLLAAQGTDKVVAFNNKGEELWRYEIDNLEPDKIVVSPKGNYVVASYSDRKIHKNRLFFFNNQGKLMKTFDTIYPYGSVAMGFSPEEKYLGMGDYHNVYLFETIGATLLWKSPYNSPFHIASVSVSQNGEYIAASGYYKISKQRDLRYLWLMNKAGNKIIEKNLDTRYTGRINIEISPDGKQLEVQTDEAILLFGVKGKQKEEER